MGLRPMSDFLGMKTRAGSPCHDMSEDTEHFESDAGVPVEMPLPALPRPPFWLMAAFLIMVVVTWVPLAVIARARVSKSSEPRISILQDMGTQPKYREQQSSEVFADGRADRPRVAGTVARGMLEEDDQFYRGFSRAPGASAVKYFDGFPDQVKLTPQLLQRGQQRFNIYCYVCHGYAGDGHGPVNERAMELMGKGQANWTPALSLVGDQVRARPNGHVFNTITNGIRNMPAYGTQVPPADRWAIIAYIRALELSQSAPPTVLTREQLDAVPAE
jgi:mono/diheme cytochrome c family protein